MITGIKSWPSLFIFNLFLLALIVLATRLATGLHEIVGHALPAAAFGSEIRGIRISLFGGGYTYYNLPIGSDAFIRFIVSFGGILVNMITGLLVLFFFRGNWKRPEWSLFLILFGMVSLLGSNAYTALGFYYEEGDPAAWSKGSGFYGDWLWLPFLMISPFISYFALKIYASLNERYFPANGLFYRAGILILTLGVTGCIYFALYEITGGRSVALNTPQLAYTRAKDEVIQNKKEILYRNLKKSNPHLLDKDIQRIVKSTPIEVKPDEVPGKFPIRPVIAFLYFVGAVFAVRNVKKVKSRFSLVVSKKAVVLTCCLTISLLAFLMLVDGMTFSSMSP